MRTRVSRGCERRSARAGRVELSIKCVAENLERRLLLSSYSVKTLATLSGVNSQTFLPESLVVDNAGNVYGTTSTGGAHDNGMVFELPQGRSTIVTLADFGSTVSTSAGGLLIDSSGNLYGNGFSDQS